MVRKTVLLGSAAAASAFTPAPSATLFGQPKIARARAATGTANLRAEEGFRDTIGKMFGMQQKVGRGIKKGHAKLHSFVMMMFGTTAVAFLRRYPRAPSPLPLNDCRTTSETVDPKHKSDYKKNPQHE